MSTPLRRRVPHAHDEPAISLMSRLAACNHVDLLTFGRHMELPLLTVLNGDRDAVERLAMLAGLDPDTILAASVRKVDEGRFRLRGQDLTVPVMRRRRPWLCPICARSDVKESGRRPAEAVHCRATWTIEQIRTCPEHGVTLLDLPSGPKGPAGHDQGIVFRHAFENLEEHFLAARHRQPSDLEWYLLRRLEFGSGGVEWLDSLAFHAVATLVERVGAVSTFDRRISFARLTPDDWWAAGIAGFAILERGQRGLIEFLDELQATFEYGPSGIEGAHAVYGALYSWLEGSGQGADFDPVRDVVRQQILERFPVAPGTSVFGELVEGRRLHSIRSASNEYGRHPVRLRRLLAAEGLLPPDHVGRHDAVVTFDADAARRFLEGASDVMTKAEARQFLNVSSVDVLVRGGALTPMPRPVGKREGQVEFNRKNVIRLMGDLLRHAVDVEGDLPENITLRTASRRTLRPLGQVVQMIVAGEWPWVGRRLDVEGFESIVVRARDIPTMMQGIEAAGLLRHQVTRALKTTDFTVGKLLDHGKLVTHSAMSVRRNILVQIVKFDNLDEFKTTYVSLYNFARELRIHQRRLKVILDSRGILPALSKEEYGAAFYLRSSLP